MKRWIKISIASIALCLSSGLLLAQENHYWMNQFGPTSSFLSGAVTGGVRDNSLLYYNPGAAAFTKGFNLSLQSDAIYNQNIYVENGAGTGINVHFNSFETSPQLFAFTNQSKKNPKWHYTFGWLTTAYSNIRFRASNEVELDMYQALPGNEYYTGSWNYRNRMREDWYGGALTKQFSEKFGLGVSTFFTYRSYEFVETQDQNIWAETNGQAGEYKSIRHISTANYLDGGAGGLLWKIGGAYEFNDFKFGLTVTTPRIQIDFLGYMIANSSQYSNISGPDSLLDVPNYSVQYNRAVSTYRSPLIVDLGVMKNFFDTDIYLRLGYFDEVALYSLIESGDSDNEFEQGLFSVTEGVGLPYLAQRRVWNFALGWNRKITEKYTMMAGFRTDFNYIDLDALQDSKGYTPEISYWNLYHVTAGTNISILKHNFTLGCQYSFGYANNQSQFVNLNAPVDGQKEIYGSSESNAVAHVDQFSITIGYVYNFL